MAEGRFSEVGTTAGDLALMAAQRVKEMADGRGLARCRRLIGVSEKESKWRKGNV